MSIHLGMGASGAFAKSEVIYVERIAVAWSAAGAPRLSGGQGPVAAARVAASG